MLRRIKGAAITVATALLWMFLGPPPKVGGYAELFKDQKKRAYCKTVLNLYARRRSMQLWAVANTRRQMEEDPSTSRYSREYLKYYQKGTIGFT
jgi:hypothetical protein